MAGIWMVELAWAAIGVAHDPRWTGVLAAQTIYVQSNSGPNWTEVVTAVATAVGAASVFFALIGAINAKSSLDATLEQVKVAAEQVNESQKGRHVSLMVDMARRWDDQDMREIRKEIEQLSVDDFRKSYNAARKTKSEQLFRWKMLAGFFEDLGLLVTMGALDIELADESLGNSIVKYWKKWSEPAIEERGEESRLYEHWEKMAHEIVERNPGEFDPV